MGFGWDEAKNRANIEKHDLSFEAALIFDGYTVDRQDGRFDYGETRTVSIGLIREIVAVTVVHTDRAGITRIISARLANKREKKLYYDHREEIEGTRGEE